MKVPLDAADPDDDDAVPRSPSPPSWWTAALRQELEAIYRQVDAEVQATGVTCWVRGLCCDFEKLEHVLYASSIELAFAEEALPPGLEPAGRLCPFWRDRLCTLRERRPLGCRTYFCDARGRDRREDIYERYYDRLKALARRLGLPWTYQPFVESLRRLSGGGASTRRP